MQGVNIVKLSRRKLLAISTGIILTACKTDDNVDTPTPTQIVCKSSIAKIQ